MAEPIKMPFGRLTHVDPRNHILDESQSLHKKLQFWGGCPVNCKALTVSAEVYTARDHSIQSLITA